MLLKRAMKFWNCHRMALTTKPGYPGFGCGKTIVDRREVDLRTVGVAQIKSTAGYYHTPTAFQILLRSPDDLHVVEMPSWWTATHALYLLLFAGWRNRAGPFVGRRAETQGGTANGNDPQALWKPESLKPRQRPPAWRRVSSWRI